MKVVHHLNHRRCFVGCCQTCKASSSKAPMDVVVIHVLSLGFVSGDCLLATSGNQCWEVVSVCILSKSLSSFSIVVLATTFHKTDHALVDHSVPCSCLKMSYTIHVSDLVLKNWVWNSLVTCSQLQQHTSSRWWFQTFCIFTPILGQDEPILMSMVFNWDQLDHPCTIPCTIRNPFLHSKYPNPFEAQKRHKEFSKHDWVPWCQENKPSLDKSKIVYECVWYCKYIVYIMQYTISYVFMEYFNLLYYSGLSYKSYKIDKAQKDHTMHQSNIHIVILSICKCFFSVVSGPKHLIALCCFCVTKVYTPQFEFDLNPRYFTKRVIYWNYCIFLVGGFKYVLFSPWKLG